MAGGSAPRFAPDDPSLPPPWKALVDGNTGYIYYWNTDTNVTQYEKPSSSSVGPPLPPGPPPVPSLSGVTPKQPGIPSSESKPLEKRSSAGTGMSPGSISNKPSRIEEIHSIVSPSRMSGSGSRFSSSGGHLPSGHHDFSDSMYGNNSSNAANQPQRSHISEHHGRHIPEHHGRYMSDHYSRSTSDHHGGLTSSRSTSDHHGGHTSDLRSRSIPDHQSGHLSNHHIPEHHGGHMSHHHNRPLMPEHHGGHFGLSASRSGHSISGSASRSSGHGIVGGGMHDSSWGASSGRQTHGSPVGLKEAPSSRNDHDAGARSIPKLAALPIPQRQQTDMRGAQYSDQQRQVGHSSSSSLGRPSPSATPVGVLKRSAGDYTSGAEVHKRPRLQSFSEPSMPSDVQAYRNQHEITVMGENIPPPFMTFDIGNIPPEILKELRSAGFDAPTPIQAQSWPIAVQKRDIVAIAKTGSGKTLGYLLPAFLHLLQIRANSRAGPIVLVLAPTRELATQIQDEAVKFGRSSRISSTCVYGGAPKGPQLRDLERGADIVIATPGRLNDFLEAKKVSLRQVSYLVLDEADRMLDMGFEPQIRKIVKDIPTSRQTLMFTATWPKEVRKIAADLLVNAVHVNIGNADELTANKAITQHVEVVQPFQKQRRLEEILRSQEPGAKVIIFCSTKKMCDQLARSLSRGFRAVAIHGDKSQGERDHVLAQFKAGKCPILVATDVAARGLDVKDIRVVINYDFPTGVEDYVHRIGRTGRAGATGEAFTFFSEQDAKFARELVKILEGADQKVPFELRQFAGRMGQSRGRGRWQTGGVAAAAAAAEEPFDSRGGVGHRGVSLSGRDRAGGFGHRDGALSNEPAGRWGFVDPGFSNRDVGRDFNMGSRAGIVGDRVGGMVNRDVRIGSRVEGNASRTGGMGSRGEIVPMRKEDVNGAMGIRGGGALGSRDSGRTVEGGTKDGWGGDDGWGTPSGSGGWGQSGSAGPDSERGRVRRDLWSDTGRSDGSSGGIGGRSSFGPAGRQPELRGRIFDRLGDGGRSTERSRHNNFSTDGRMACGDDSRKLIGSKEETRRSSGSYSRSPGKGWRGSGSPRKGSRSRTPNKGWGTGRSHSRSPGRGWGGSNTHRSPSKGWGKSRSRSRSPGMVGTNIGSPTHGMGSDEHHGQSRSFSHGRDGLGKRSTTSSHGSLHSPQGDKRSSSRRLSHQPSQEDEHGKHDGEYREEPKASEDYRGVPSAGPEGLSNDRGSQPASLRFANEPSAEGKPVIGPNAPDGEGQKLLLPNEGSSISSLPELYTAEDDRSLLDLVPSEEATLSASGLLASEPQYSTQMFATKEHLPSKQDVLHEPLSAFQASTTREISKVGNTTNDNGVLATSSGHTKSGINADILSDHITGSNLDNTIEELQPLVEESRKLVDSKTTYEVHTADHFSDVTALQTDTNDVGVSSPEEGMVL